MKKSAFKFFAIVTVCLFTITSCSKEDITPPGPGPNPDPNGLTFEKVINTGGSFDSPLVNSQVENVDSSTVVQNNEEWRCVTQTLNVNAASGGSSGFPLFDVGSDVIYPGSMLQGNSLNSGNPNPIVVQRAGGTISTNILDGNLVSSFEVDEVKKSSITDAINNIIANATGTLPANFNIKIESVQSREQFALALGVDVNSTFVDLESNLNYSSSSERSSFLVSLNQSYYTMSFDLPTSLEQLFAPSVTPAQLANYVSEGNPATYISSVTYGRIFYMLIESSSSESDLEIAVDAAFNGVTTEVEATLDVNHFSSLENVTYSVFAYGGDAGPTYGAIGVTDMNTLIDVLEQSSTLGSAKALSYVVRSVKDNQIVATQLATTYDVVDCYLSSALGNLPALEHWVDHPLFDSFGGVTAAYSEGDNKFILLNEQGQWLRSTFVNGVGNLEGPYNLSSSYPLSGVGAACKYNGPDYPYLLVVDPSGTEFTTYNQTTGEWNPPTSIADWPLDGGDPHPFAAGGASAIAYAKQASNGSISNFWFNRDGDKYSRNRLLQGWSDVFDIHQDWGGGVLDGKIDKVGAATGYTLGIPGLGDHFYILFNGAGDQYVIFGNVDGTGDKAVGPFNL